MLMRLIQNRSPLKITLFWEATFKWIILYPLMLFSQLIIGIITYNSFHSYYEVGTMEDTLHRLIYSPPYPLEVDRCTIREVKRSKTPGVDLTLFFFRGSGEQAAVNGLLWRLQPTHHVSVLFQFHCRSAVWDAPVSSGVGVTVEDNVLLKMLCSAPLESGICNSGG